MYFHMNAGARFPVEFESEFEFEFELEVKLELEVDLELELLPGVWSSKTLPPLSLTFFRRGKSGRIWNSELHS